MLGIALFKEQKLAVGPEFDVAKTRPVVLLRCTTVSPASVLGGILGNSVFLGLVGKKRLSQCTFSYCVFGKQLSSEFVELLKAHRNFLDCGFNQPAELYRLLTTTEVPTLQDLEYVDRNRGN